MEPIKWEQCPASYHLGHGCRKLVGKEGTSLWSVGPGSRAPGKGFELVIVRECGGDRYSIIAASEGKILGAVRDSGAVFHHFAITDLIEDRWVGRVNLGGGVHTNDETGAPDTYGLMGGVLSKPPVLMDEFPNIFESLDARTSKSTWAISFGHAEVILGRWGARRVLSKEGTLGHDGVLIGDNVISIRRNTLVVSNVSDSSVLTTSTDGQIVDLGTDGDDLVWVTESPDKTRKLFSAPFTADPAAFMPREVGPVEKGDLKLVGCKRVLFTDRNQFRLVSLGDGASTTLPNPACYGTLEPSCWDSGIVLTCDELVAGLGRSDSSGTAGLTVVRVELPTLLSVNQPSASPSSSPSAAASLGPTSSSSAAPLVPPPASSPSPSR